MGNFISNALAMAVSVQNQRSRIPHRIFRTVNCLENLLLCGGKQGSVAENKCLCLMEKRIDSMLQKDMPAVILSADACFNQVLFDNYGDKLCMFGENAFYDPFLVCQTKEESAFILEEILRSCATEIPDDDGLLKYFCHRLNDLMNPELGKCHASFSGFSLLAECAVHSQTAEQFFHALEEKKIAVPVSVQDDVKFCYDKISERFRNFWILVSSSFSDFQSPVQVQNMGSTEKFLHEGRTVLFGIRPDSQPVLSAFYAELRIICGRKTAFCFLNHDVPIPPETAGFLFREDTEQTFFLYFSELQGYFLPDEAVIRLMDSIISVGVSSYEDAELLAVMSAELLRGTEQQKALHPSLLMYGVRGIPDGGACIMRSTGAVCCSWLYL